MQEKQILARLLESQKIIGATIGNVFFKSNNNIIAKNLVKITCVPHGRGRRRGAST